MQNFAFVAHKIKNRPRAKWLQKKKRNQTLAAVEPRGIEALGVHHGLGDEHCQ